MLPQERRDVGARGGLPPAVPHGSSAGLQLVLRQGRHGGRQQGYVHDVGGGEEKPQVPACLVDPAAASTSSLQ